MIILKTWEMTFEKYDMKMPINNEFILRGEKILLRNFTKSDIDDRYIGWLNDSTVVRFSNQRFLTHSYESSLRYFSSFENTDNLFLSICHLPDEEPIGTMTAYVSRFHETVDVGILLGEKSVWGSGLGLDAWNTLTNWLLECDGIRKITAGTLACNYAMIKILERSGMHHEATRKKQEIVNTKAVDILYYAKFSAT